MFTESESIVIFENNSENKDLEEFLESKDVSGRLFRKLYKEKKIYVNDKYQRKGIKLKSGDRVVLVMDDETESIQPEDISLDIIYEDCDLLILNKAPNIVVHPTKSHQTNTLSNGIAMYFKNNSIKKKIRFVNRLDMDTTGILIVAKNPFAHQQMALQFEEHTIEKKYRTIVKGIIQEDSGTIDQPIGREEDKSIKKMVIESGQQALTTFKVIERYKDSTMLEVQIHTGRSHQIRVHLDFIGHPIIGDVLYNEASDLINRQALHSYYLKAKHPRTKQYLEFIAPLPWDLQNLINLMKE